MKCLLVLAAASTLFLTGCLETRSSVQEAQEKQVMRKQLTTIQQSNADVNERFQDISDELKKLAGRMEALENHQQQLQGRMEKADNALDGRIKENDGVYREEFKKLGTEIEQTRTQITEMMESQKHAAQVEARTPTDSFKAAEEKFGQKSWKEAILDYERYRKGSPRGKNFGMATYKIGVAFQELGMTDEAKAFYEEVLSKFPKTKESAKASAKLKSLKSKR